MNSALTKYRVECAKKLHGNILDLGAGEGRYTSYLKGNVTSLDIDSFNLKQIRGDKVVASADRIPFRDDTFDGVWGCGIIAHVDTNIIPEIVRVTKVGGTIYLLTANRYSPFDPIKRLFGLGDWWDGHTRLYSTGELRRFGKVTGEVWWFPLIDRLARILPFLSHTLMLRIDVTQTMKDRLAKWPNSFWSEAWGGPKLDTLTWMMSLPKSHWGLGPH